MIDYLSPKCRLNTLDGYTNVSLLLESVKRILPQLSGCVLDVGCGNMPYKAFILRQNKNVEKYLGLDIHHSDSRYPEPDIKWDGKIIPLPDNAADSVILTEVLEHCPDAYQVLCEIYRVLKPGGLLFLTVPFIWPIHDAPYDEFRYTPYSLERFLQRAGFIDIQIEGTGGRHALLSVVLGLWVRRRDLTSRVHIITKAVFSILLCPIIWWLHRIDHRPTNLGESTLVVGLCSTARKS